jgi:hypothetical protein
MSHEVISEHEYLASSVFCVRSDVSSDPTSHCQQWSPPNPGPSDQSQHLAEEWSLSSNF